ncbi:uncharacterized protein LOC106643424 [Copidosoma floridanum]|uniref:uncharacterized protein LOC106643424 n=1 Tax=Copidosoma floridanum TaxID=29053 RepID=UPI0006C9D0A9|nr:uncharacterized protein LOC106643424 [Copidosoma floridanum]
MAIEYARFMDEYLKCGHMQLLTDSKLYESLGPIWMENHDVDLQRILWSTDNSNPPKHYQLLTVTYGEASAPYLSPQTISQLFEDKGHAWFEAVPIVKQDQYVDDILSGADNVETARIHRDQLIGLSQARGFPLKKWVANDPELFCDLSPDAPLRPAWQRLNIDGLVSEFGGRWDPIDDRFYLTPPTLHPQLTKRAMLAVLARLFDPCGWIAPVVLAAKLFIQDLWQACLEWDEPVPAAMAQRWSGFLVQLQNVSKVAIPRWIGCSLSTSLQLHAFADAMAAVVYLGAERLPSGVCVRILIFKTELTSIKSLQPDSTSPIGMTIPRLELRAALLAARLLRMVLEECAVSIEHRHTWSDFQIVLHCLRSSEPTNNALIDNHVAHIQELLPSHVWGHVPTASNPADMAS